MAGNVHDALTMRVFRVLCVSYVVLGRIGSARAEGPPAAPPVPPSATSSLPRSMAVGSNLPILWNDGNSVAGSVSVSVFDHHAIRANLATYKNHGSIAKDTLSGLAGGDSVDNHGRITDLGISWVYYPERVWDGLMLEAGALRRGRDVGTYDGDAMFAFADKQSTVYAGRMMIGWSWLFYEQLFLAAAAGFSVGWESGTEVLRTDYDDRTVRNHIARQDVTGEGYLRIGAVFDL